MWCKRVKGLGGNDFLIDGVKTHLDGLQIYKGSELFYASTRIMSPSFFWLYSKEGLLGPWRFYTDAIAEKNYLEDPINNCNNMQYSIWRTKVLLQYRDPTTWGKYIHQCNS